MKNKFLKSELKDNQDFIQLCGKKYLNKNI